MINRRFFSKTGTLLLSALTACSFLLSGCRSKSETVSAGELIEAADDTISHADTIKVRGDLETRSIQSGDGREVPRSLSVDYSTTAERNRKIVRTQSDINAGYLDVSWNGSADAYYLNGEGGDTMYLCQYVSGREKNAEWKQGKTSVKASDLLEALNPFDSMEADQFRIQEQDALPDAESYDLTAVGKMNGEEVRDLILYSVSVSDPLRDYDFDSMEFDASIQFHAEKSGSFGRMKYTPLSLNLTLDKQDTSEENAALNTLKCKIKYMDLTSDEKVEIPDQAKKGNTSTELDNSGGTVYFEKLAESGDEPEVPEESADQAEGDASAGGNGQDKGSGSEADSGAAASEGDAASDQTNSTNSPGIEGETANDYKMSTFMEFNLSGLDIKLGETKLSDLMNTGLSLDHDDASVRLDPGKLHKIYFEIGEDYLETDLKNETSASQSLAECTVVGMKIHFYDFTAKVKYINELTESDYYGTYKLYLGDPTYELVKGTSDQCTWYDITELYHLEVHFSTENYLPDYLYMYLNSALEEDGDNSGGGNG